MADVSEQSQEKQTSVLDMPDIQTTINTPFDRMVAARAKLKKSIEVHQFKQITGQLVGDSKDERCFVGMGYDLIDKE